MKLAELQMRDAFAGRDWAAAQRIMAQHFGCPAILEINKLDTYGNAALSECIINLDGVSYRWASGYGFSSYSWRYSDSYYILYNGCHSPVMDVLPLTYE